MTRSNSEFVMWDQVHGPKIRAQCLWSNRIYTVTVLYGDKTKTGTFNQTEEPKFALMCSKDFEMSTALARKFMKELEQEG